MRFLAITANRIKSPTLALTGGGTAGHVMPHLALLPDFVQRRWQVFYVGSHGMECELIKSAGIPYYAISTGKLRRYFSMQNFLDLLRVGLGYFQCLWIFLTHRPQVVFSKGGFVSVPVCFAAYTLRIPVVTHESDLTPGLATRLILPVASRVLFTFRETEEFLPAKKSLWVGAITRADLGNGNAAEGLRLCGFASHDPRPVLLIMGGSTGAQRINDAIANCLESIIQKFRVIHLTGKGKKGDIHAQSGSYKAFEFVGPELRHIFACTNLVMARAGANSIFEFLELKKPMLLIPLEIGSRGDQLDNARSFEAEGLAMILREKDLSPQTLQGSLDTLKNKAPDMTAKLAEKMLPDSRGLVLEVLSNYLEHSDLPPLPAQH